MLLKEWILNEKYDLVIFSWIEENKMKVIHGTCHLHCTKMKFSIKDFFSKCDQIRRKPHKNFLKKSLMENFIFCAVKVIHGTCCHLLPGTQGFAGYF